MNQICQHSKSNSPKYFLLSEFHLRIELVEIFSFQLPCNHLVQVLWSCWWWPSLKRLVIIFLDNFKFPRWSDMRPAPWATSSGRPPTSWCSWECGWRLTWCQSLCHRCSTTLASSTACLSEYEIQNQLWAASGSVQTQWRVSGSVGISWCRIQVISSPPRH